MRSAEKGADLEELPPIRAIWRRALFVSFVWFAASIVWLAAVFPHSPD
ncbi:hypothetical protein ARTHRO9V_280140 [Arthrobacter sp. 9V]|nr:hypothetical protein ARTHRO9V_280140 [Arthrobacter sp. 9V]